MLKFYVPLYYFSCESQEAAAARYNFTASSLPDITVGMHVAVQNTRTRSWDTYGIVTFIGPHRQYHVCTTRGKMLVRNHCFLCRWVREPLPSGGIRSEASQPTQVQNEGTEEAQPIQRRSTCQGKPVSRLLEDPSWP